MMTWNYRVFHEDDGTYIIREVYYEDDGAIMACTEDAVQPLGESLDELAREIEYFRQALQAPVLILADIPKPKNKTRERKPRTNRTLEQVAAELHLDKPARKTHRTHSASKNGKRRVLAATGK